jgi:hypothetical protein
MMVSARISSDASIGRCAFSLGNRLGRGPGRTPLGLIEHLGKTASLTDTRRSPWARR